MSFENWLKTEKEFTVKAAHDVVSRLNRVKQILSIDSIDNLTLAQLEKSDSFKELSVSVKSQLRRSVRLNLEFQAMI